MLLTYYNYNSDDRRALTHKLTLCSGINPNVFNYDANRKAAKKIIIREPLHHLTVLLFQVA